MAERYEFGDSEGVPRDWLLEHVAKLASESHIDEEEFRAALENVTTDSAHWVDDSAVYEMGDGERLSAYPSAWHEDLTEKSTLPDAVRYLVEETEYQAVDAGAGDGIPESNLLDIVAAVTGHSREEVKVELETLRKEGRLIEDADQHPGANVYPPEEDGVQQDPDAKENSNGR